eukprot:SAG11_NODE_267_length_11457_cov_14.773728_7_plen_250_part_00
MPSLPHVPRLSVAFAGTPPFAATVLRALLARPAAYRICGVLTAADRRSGRGRKVNKSAVKVVAEAASLPLLQPVRLRGEEGEATLRKIERWAPDVLVVAAYGLILPKPLLMCALHGAINVHASLLPRWRGAAPVERAIEAGDMMTGVSIMAMDEGCDTGAVYRRAATAVSECDSLGSLTERLAELGTVELMQTLNGLWDGKVTATAQHSGGGACYAHKVVKADAALDFRHSALELARKVPHLLLTFARP